MTAECPICYIPIEYNKNCVTTECGHKFHCSCLLAHTATNGFNCPYCRCKTAEEVDYESDHLSDHLSENEEEEENAYPTVEYITQKLLERGYNINDFVHYLLVDYEFEELTGNFYTNNIQYNNYEILYNNIEDIIQIYRETLIDPNRRDTYLQNLVN